MLGLAIATAIFIGLRRLAIARDAAPPEPIRMQDHRAADAKLQAAIRRYDPFTKHHKPVNPASFAGL